ncbi:nuclear transport factor 2 family protein [Herbiconiux sp. VKM Ac-1786]|uniref:nuclear transport factor 2 family protein n=1 Tax=Herbiconiux sp. VKM Ac-1786 TaxID=2783824 RepID=UPI001889EAC9|nr:nuclear transport factor 2 family protein [Herbiconiux sp. VKM Ac-1786]MBF4571896.1 nuclear transport factor 2 family protein [Herbiconiux sp. VKM Ac-1786]
MSTYESRATFVNDLRSALSTQDKTKLTALVHNDVVWALPGDNAVSGETVGVDGIFTRLAKLSSFDVRIEIQNGMVSPDGVAMVLHNTGTHNGLTLDEYLVSAVTLVGDKASRIDTYISDIPMMDAYFV